MEINDKTITADEFVEIPEDIIHKIHSLMDERDAARSTLVSKAWYRAWCTRPDVVFDMYDFPTNMHLFGEIANKTMKRYEDLNLSIRSLRLLIHDPSLASLAKELIVRAMNLGVVHLKLQLPSFGSSLVLPDELHESKTLARLSLNGSINLNKRVPNSSINVKSLELDLVTIRGDLFRDLIARCPLIEELTLRNTMRWFGKRRRRPSPFYDPSINFDDNLVFRKLKYLCIEFLDIKETVSRREHDLWAKFPCLKELKISHHHMNDLSDVRICIPSLERISIRVIHFDLVNVEFDFPNIRKFEFDSALPRGSFELKTSGRREWESEIHTESYAGYGGEWFTRLSQFLRMLTLSRSRILSLSITASRWEEFTNDHPIYVGDGLASPAVEELKLMGDE